MITLNALDLVHSAKRLAYNFFHYRSHISAILETLPGQQLLELDIKVELPWAESRDYEYSKLYYRRPEDKHFSESDVICFRIRYSRRQERIRICLPEQIQQWPNVIFRVDASPYAQGRFNLYYLGLVDPAHDNEEEAQLTRSANLSAQRKQVELSETQLEILPGQQLLELVIKVELPWAESRDYEYSKLYYRRPEDKHFSESDVICFRIRYSGRRERIRICLSEQIQQWPNVIFRVDALPYAQGRFNLYYLGLVDPAQDNEEEAQLTRSANLSAQKEWVRKQVELSETQLRNFVPHYPESIGLELTPNCNFTCGHCSSHGTAELHRAHNKMSAMSREMLTDLATEVFPHLTVINIVGRGETTMASNALWSDFVEHVRKYQVFISLVTNAYDLKRKITIDLIAHIDTLTISIDGITEHTFAANRGGASLAHTMSEIAYFNDLRRNAGLARRPKLCLSWTLKKNNIGEFPDFIRTMAKFEPDLIYARHLLVFHEKDRAESLLDIPDEANVFLAEAYTLMRKFKIRSECPPLFGRPESSVTTSQALATVHSDLTSLPPVTDHIDPTSPDRVADRCIWIHRTGSILAGGEISTCGRHYAASAGNLATATSFMEVWNGPEMLGIRAAFGTAQEWSQCKNCWYRESRYDAQRNARAKRDNYLLDIGSKFSTDAWDFRGFEVGGLMDKHQ